MAEPRDASREDVARGRRERLSAHEDIRGRYRKDGRSSLIGVGRDLDRAHAHVLETREALARREVDAEQILRGDGRELSVREGTYIVRPAIRVFELVRRETNGERATRALRCQRAIQRLRRRTIGRARGLVQQQHIGLDRERPCDGDPLHLAVGQLMPATREELGDAEPFGDVVYQLGHRCASVPAQPQTELKIPRTGPPNNTGPCSPNLTPPPAPGPVARPPSSPPPPRRGPPT